MQKIIIFQFKIIQSCQDEVITYLENLNVKRIQDTNTVKILLVCETVFQKNVYLDYLRKGVSQSEQNKVHVSHSKTF